MTVLIALFAGIATVSGLLARALVPGARDQRVSQTVGVGAAVTLTVGLLGWFVVTPLPAFLDDPVAVTLSMVGGLLGVAAWRTGRAPGRRDMADREHRQRPGSWTRDPRYS